jgi:hypothetical protein
MSDSMPKVTDCHRPSPTASLHLRENERHANRATVITVETQ